MSARKNRRRTEPGVAEAPAGSRGIPIPVTSELMETGPREIQHSLRRLSWPSWPRQWFGIATGTGAGAGNLGAADFDPRRPRARSSRLDSCLTRSRTVFARCRPTATRFHPEDRWAIVLYLRALQRSQTCFALKMFRTTCSHRFARNELNGHNDESTTATAVRSVNLERTRC